MAKITEIRSQNFCKILIARYWWWWRGANGGFFVIGSLSLRFANQREQVSCECAAQKAVWKRNWAQIFALFWNLKFCFEKKKCVFCEQFTFRKSIWIEVNIELGLVSFQFTLWTLFQPFTVYNVYTVSWKKNVKTYYLKLRIQE